MKIKRTMTDKALAASRANSEKGKQTVSENAVKHGILSQKLRLQTDREKTAHKKLIRDLQKTVDWDDPIARVYAEEFAAAAVRRARFLSLEQALYRRPN